MPNATRVVNGTLTKADNTAWVGQTITFETALPTYTAASQVPVASVSVTTTAGGAFTVTLICTTEFIVRSEYKVTYPSGTSTTFRYFELPAGSAIELSVLLEASNPVSVAPSTLLAQLDALIATHAAIIASATVLGHIKVGSGLTIDPVTGVLTATATSTDLSAYMTKAANLSDLASVSTARTNLGLGSLALLNAITSGMVTTALGYTPLSPANNLSEVTPATARTNLGLGSVENTALSTWAGSTNLTTAGVLTATSLATALLNPSGNIIEQRNGVNAQTQYTYASYTDASNYTRGKLAASTTAITLAAESAGTGSANIDVSVNPKGTGKLNTTATLFQLGGTTSSFPALKRNGGQVDFRTADDANYASINVGGLTSAGGDINVYNVGLTTRYFAVRPTTSQARAIASFVYGWSDSATDAATGTFDTGLARASAGVVKVTDGSSGSGAINIKGVAGAVSDASFTVAPPDGTLALDTTNFKLYCRFGGVWKAATFV